MSDLKGKLRAPEDLKLLLHGLEKRKGKLTLSLPYFGDRVSICTDGRTWKVNPNFRDFQVFVEKWKIGSVHPSFFMNEETCQEGTEIDKERILELLSNPLMNKIGSLPESFLIERISLENVPSCLVSMRRLRKPVKRWDIYRCGLTLLKFAELIENGLIEIRPFKLRESLPLWLGLALNLFLITGFVTLILPTKFLKLNEFKYNEAINWSLRETVLGKRETLTLPVKGCLDSLFILEKDRVVYKGNFRNFLLFKKVLKLPVKGYRPVFCLPEK